MEIIIKTQKDLDAGNAIIEMWGSSQVKHLTEKQIDALSSEEAEKYEAWRDAEREAKGIYVPPQYLD